MGGQNSNLDTLLFSVIQKMVFTWHFIMQSIVNSRVISSPHKKWPQNTKLALLWKYSSHILCPAELRQNRGLKQITVLVKWNVSGVTRPMFFTTRCKPQSFCWPAEGYTSLVIIFIFSRPYNTQCKLRSWEVFALQMLTTLIICIWSVGFLICI